MMCKVDYANSVKIIMLQVMAVLWVVREKEGFILLMDWQL
jgi:hypothetical protein